MKVAHLVSGLRGGGAEHMILGICRQAANDPEVSMSVVVMSLINDIGFKFHGIDVFPRGFTTPGRRDPGRIVSSLQAILYLIKTNPPVIHAHMFYAAMAAVIVKLFRPRTAIIFSLHNSFQPGVVAQILLWLTRPLRRTDTIFPNARPQWYQKSNAAIIPNGIEVSDFNRAATRRSSPFIILFVGRVAEQKQPLALVDIASELAGKHNIVVRVAGNGPMLNTLRQKAAQRNLQHVFEFIPFSNDVAGLLGSSHCLILPSKYEGMPLIVLEAAAATLPLVCTPEAVKAFSLSHNEATICHVSQISGRISQMIGNYEIARGQAALLKISLSKYSIRTSYLLHMQLYRSALHNIW